ncbi:MAG: helix-turn-helix transcriptional regulator [Clostridiales bacterium]|nr:helix-turn-helix transcriptional regulator [Clostridiales bacterium]
MQFHEKLKELRKDRGFTQEELAEKLHVSRSAVAKWENGLGLPSDDSIRDISEYFGVAREDMLADRETQTIIVEKNSMLSRQKKWLITLIALAGALLIETAVFLGVVLNWKHHEAGYNRIITGITADFAVNSDEYEEVSDYNYVQEGKNEIKVYHLKVGETYKFYTKPTWLGSETVAFPKSAFNVFYDSYLLTFDEGDYNGEVPEYTYSDEFPFLFTCVYAPAETEIYVTAYQYYCKVKVIIEN